MYKDSDAPVNSLALERVELLDEGAYIWFSCVLAASFDEDIDLRFVQGKYRRRTSKLTVERDDFSRDGRKRCILLKGWLEPFVVDARLRVIAKGQGQELKLKLKLDRPMFEAAIDCPLPSIEFEDINAQDDLGHHERMCARRQQEFLPIEPQAADPLISIVVPVYRPAPDYLTQMIDSVLAQTYPHFELVLVNVSGDCPEVDEVLTSYDDSRIRLLSAENRSISENTNVGIEASVGDYVAFVDHDDFIEPDTLERYVETIRAHPLADLLFCNEDVWGEIDGNPRFYGPKYKPGFNIDLLMTHNYVCHMLMVSRWALEHTQRSTSHVTGAQDYDLSFKAAEIARDICCVPHMLYHWREHPLSTVSNRQSKPYAFEAGRLSIQEHLDRTGIACHVDEGAFPFSYRVHYEMPQTLPRVSIIVAEAQDPERLSCLIGTVRSQTEAAFADQLEFVVVCENGYASTQIRASAQAAGARVVPCARAANHAQKVNMAVKAATGEFCVLLDEVFDSFSEGWLSELIAPFARPDVGCCAPMLLSADKRILAHGCILRDDASLGFAERGLMPDDRGYMTMPLHARDCHVVLEQGMCFRRTDFLGTGGFYEGLDKLAFMSFCLNLAERHQLVLSIPYAPLSCAHDISSVFSRSERELICKLWPQVQKGDKYLDPSLDARSNHFSLRKEAQALCS